LSFVDAYSRHAFAMVTDDLVDLDVSEFLENEVQPWYEARSVRLETIRTDRRMPFIDAGRNGYKTWLQKHGIDHTYRLTKSRARQDVGLEFAALAERELFLPMFRAGTRSSLVGFEQALADWVNSYNRERPQPGPFCYGKTPEKTFLDAVRFVPGRYRRVL